MSFAVKLLLPVFKRLGPEIAVALLTAIQPGELAAKLRPHLEVAIKRMPLEWQRSFVLALRRIAEIAVASVPEAKP